MGRWTKSAAALWAAVAVALGVQYSEGARPLVRNVRTNDEFVRLLNYHRDVTGMGVIVDFYSDGCGPCRQIAPHYKELAKQYKDKVVFAKVDVNGNRETSGIQRIRSMPTFQFYMDGKKRHQFSGGDLPSLQNWAQRFSKSFTENNVKVTRESLEAFYGEHAPEKVENLDKIIEKAGGEKGGKGHKSLVNALKKKYGVAPKTEVRYDPNAKAGGEKTPPPSTKSSGNTKAKVNPAEPNLHLASIEELSKELEKRKAEMEAQAQEAGEAQGEEEDEDDEHGGFEPWKEHDSGAAEQLVIIGGGPAGLSAAVYASRAGLRPVVVAPPGGGQLQGKGVLVENYPAVVDSTGPAVVFEMQKQAALYGSVFHDEMVTKVELSSTTGVPHKVETNTTSIKAHTIIIATGADSRWLGVEGEEEFRGGGVSSCATCDGYLYRDKPVIVIGGGDTAMEEALHLAGTSSEVTIIHRGSSFEKASVVLAKRVLEHEKIKIKWESTVVAFKGRVETDEEREQDPHLQAHGADLTDEQPILTHVLVQTKGADEPEKLEVDGAFIAIGHDPNTGLFKDQLEMNSVGYLTTTPPSTRTSVQGVYAAGDVADPIYRQAITSAGTGAMAALDAERHIHEHNIPNERKIAEDEFMRELLEDIQASKPAEPEDCADPETN
mmetsp:Transcript_5349/g.10052  ORF Transcript_5349/g.10052 Transcript_5349/m.10052 type:complete len:661 (+) Transcript_5349:112-2094(+)